MKTLKSIKSLTLSLFITLLVGCNNGIAYKAPVFENEKTVSAQPISNIILVQGGVVGFENCYDYFVVIAKINNKMVHLFSKASGELVASGVALGRANNELIDVLSYSFDPSQGELILLSSVDQKMLRVVISKSAELTIEKASGYNATNGNTNILKKDSDSYIKFASMPKEPNHRISIISNNKELSYYDKLPIDDIEKISRIYVQPVIAFNPDISKLVIGTKEGLIFETLSLKNNKIKELKTSYFYESIIPKTAHDIYEMYWGVTDILATDDFIYAVYIGNKGISNNCKLAKFDWNHTPLELIEVEGYSLSYICIDNGVIYAIARDLPDNEYRIVHIGNF
ncbi:MAG: hypothetical protein R3Y26_02140 [Rikenellaceae bacterium]